MPVDDNERFRRKNEKMDWDMETFSAEGVRREERQGRKQKNERMRKLQCCCRHSYDVAILSCHIIVVTNPDYQSQPTCLPR